MKDISKLKGKQANDLANQFKEQNAIPDEQTVSNEEWNELVEATEELQAADSKSIKGIKFNGQLVNVKDGVAEFAQSGTVDQYYVEADCEIGRNPSRTLKKDTAMPLRMRYAAYRRTAAGRLNLYGDVPGTMTITRQMLGSTLVETVYTRTGIRPVESDSEEWNVVVDDLSQYFRTGEQNINVRFSSTYTQNGTTQTMDDVISIHVNVIDLRVENMQDFLNPLDGNSGQFPSIKLNLSGAVQEKVLHVEISGKTQLSSYEGSVTIGSSKEGEYYLQAINDNELIRMTAHGVHTVKTWLTCSDGAGGELKSDINVARFMVVNASATAAERARTYLLLQATVEECYNNTQVKIGDFGIWRSAEEDLGVADMTPQNMKVIVTDFTSTDDGYNVVYGDQNFIDITPQKSYSAECSVEIESDDKSIESFFAYARFLLEKESGGYENLMQTSGIMSTNFVGIKVINSYQYAPASGAWFYINPKSRSNSEADWDKITNARANNALIHTEARVSRTHSMWQKDDSGIPILRLNPGDSLRIQDELADAFYEMYRNGNSDISIEIDYKVRNVTRPNDPILQLTDEYNGEKLGVELQPYKVQATCKGSQNVTEQSVGLRENVRTNLILTWNHLVDPRDEELDKYPFSLIKPEWTYKALSLCRIYVNGNPNKEFRYSTENRVWQHNAHGTQFLIGSDGAAIDIYNVKFYNKALSPDEIKQCQVAAKPSREEKDQILQENDIVDSRGRIDCKKVQKNLKRNVFILHAEADQWKNLESSKQPCYLEIHIFDPSTGEELLDQGGYIGRYAYEAMLQGLFKKEDALKWCFSWKSQGSTANTYGFHNGQGKVKDIKWTVTISMTQLHKDFGWKAKNSNPDKNGKIKYPITLNGEPVTGDEYNLLPEAQQKECMITVPDGWFDFNLDYHGQFFRPSKNGSKANKICEKINYASAMMHHKMGMTNLYNDVMRNILTKHNDMPDSHANSAEARFAVEEQPFFHFYQPDENADPIFHGFSTFGSAKADKPTWGYDEDAFPYMCMFEGADNNVPLADFRVPFDEEVKPYWNAAKGDWSWAIKNAVDKKDAEVQLDFDLGLTAGDMDESLTEDIDKEAPWAPITEYLRTFCNLFYTHNSRIKYWDKNGGTLSSLIAYYNSLDPELQSLEMEQMRLTTYWCTADFCLYRFHFTTMTFVDAGRWVDRGMKIQPNGSEVAEQGMYVSGRRNLSTDFMTADAFQKWQAEGTMDYDLLNQMFRKAICQHFTSIDEEYISRHSFMTHYNLVNSMGGGTDNCSKNTYFVLCSITKDGVTKWKWYWFTDDVDTIFMTNNNGAQTKIWWVFRFTDKQDVANGYKEATDYEGNGSVMFNLCEDAYDDNLTREDGVTGTSGTPLQQNMQEVLAAMKSLVSASDNILGYTSESTIMACWHKYFLQYARYFPMLAWSEQARIRYEYPEAWGYRSTGAGARNVAPITQQIGDQRECEIDFLEKRSVLYAQYACWGEARADQGSLGVPGSGAQVSFKGKSELGPLTLRFRLQSDRPFYATGTSGDTRYNPHVRVMPGQIYEIEIKTTGDQGCGLCCADYYTELGDFGNARISPDAVAIDASRLRHLSLTTSDDKAFNTSQLTIACTNIETFRFGCPGYKASIDLSQCLSLRDIDIKGSGINMLTLPKDTRLETIALNDKMTDVSLSSLPNLKTFSMQGYSKLQSLEIDAEIASLDYDTMLTNIYAGKQGEGAVAMKALSLYGANVDRMNVGILNWMLGISDLKLTGRMSIYQPAGASVPAVDYNAKMAMILKWGSPDERVEGTQLYSTFTTVPATQGKLTVDYFMRSLSAFWDSCGISGDAYTHKVGDYPYKLENLHAYVNAFRGVVWSISTDESLLKGAEASINPLTGLLTVTKLSVLGGSTRVSCKVLTSDGVDLLAKGKEVGLYDRLAYEGDLVYADGTFSDPDKIDAYKTPVGMCCYAAPRDGDGNLIPGRSNPEDRQQRLCVSLNNITGIGSDGGVTKSFNGFVFGPCRSTSAEEGLFYKDDQGNDVFLSDDSVTPPLTTTTFYDNPEIENFYITGIQPDPTSNLPSSSYYIGDNNLIEPGGDWLIGEPALSAVNDGFYHPNEDISQRTITQELYDFMQTQKIGSYVGDTFVPRYKVGDIVNKGFANSLKFMIQRNKILGGAGLDKVGLQGVVTPPSAHGNTTELQDLCNAMVKVSNKVRDLQGGDDTNTQKWQQILFPAPSAAFAYEPRVKQNEVLADCFRAHNWFLPTIGVLMRLYWVKRMYDKGNPTESRIVSGYGQLVRRGVMTEYVSGYYWTSSEASTSALWASYFSNGNTSYHAGSNPSALRAVSAF